MGEKNVWLGYLHTFCVQYGSRFVYQHKIWDIGVIDSTNSALTFSHVRGFELFLVVLASRAFPRASESP